MESFNLIIAVGGFSLAVLGNVALFWFGYGKLTGKVDGITQRLDVINGRLNKHSEAISQHGERLSKAEGKWEQIVGG